MANSKLADSSPKVTRSFAKRGIDVGVVAIDFGGPSGLDIPSQIRAEHNREVSVEVSIRRIEADFFEVHSCAQFPPASRVEILFRGEFVSSEVLYCRAEGDNWAIGLQAAAPHSLRREFRYPSDWPGALTVAESGSTVNVRISDYSRYGLGLLSPIELPTGSQVAVQFHRGTVFGEVRHCTGRPGYYHVGLRAF
jgi:hypothetical protein